MNIVEPEPGHEWITSDGKILQYMTVEGNRLSIVMPWGDKVRAEVENMNAQAAGEFCNLVRSTYLEWQTSKKAKSAARHAELASGGPAKRSRNEESAEVFETSAEIDYLDGEAIAVRCRVLGHRLGAIQAEARQIDYELSTLFKILEVLNDAQEIPAETGGGISSDEGGDTEESMDSGPCEQEHVQGGPTEVSETPAGTNLEGKFNETA